MNRSILRLAGVTFAALALGACAHAQTGVPVASAPIAQPQLPPVANASEQKFLVTLTPSLRARFADERRARAAGYVRYTDEDPDGIITFTDLHWFTDDAHNPAQLWYDAHGRLIGTDYTRKVTDRTRRPDIWGLQPGRWVHFIAHMHYAVREPDGSMRYGSLLNPTYVANGGDPAHPSAQPLVRMGIAHRASDVVLIFQLPEIWIASMWLVPNPRGAFADSNPLVAPSGGKHMPVHPM